MPQLDPNTQQRAEEAKPWGDEPMGGGLLPEGWYIAELIDVEDKGGDNRRWDWTFSRLREYDLPNRKVGESRAGRCWWTTTDTPESVGKINATFAAFDAPLTEDTNNLLGEEVLVYLAIEIARKGKRQGEERNAMTAIKAIPADARTDAAGPRM